MKVWYIGKDKSPPRFLNSMAIIENSKSRFVEHSKYWDFPFDRNCALTYWPHVGWVYFNIWRKP